MSTRTKPRAQGRWTVTPKHGFHVAPDCRDIIPVKKAYSGFNAGLAIGFLAGVIVSFVLLATI